MSAHVVQAFQWCELLIIHTEEKVCECDGKLESELPLELESNSELELLVESVVEVDLDSD